MRTDINSEVLNNLKQIIINPPVLRHFDSNKPIYIQCDK